MIIISGKVTARKKLNIVKNIQDKNSVSLYQANTKRAWAYCLRQTTAKRQRREKCY